MGIDRWRPSALAAALVVALGGACGRTELWPALPPAGPDGGTDVRAGGGDAATGGRGSGDDAAAGGRGGTGHRDPCSAAGKPCSDGQRCVPALFGKAIGVPGGADLLLALGDLNRDGLPDLVTVSPSQGSVAVWLNEGTTGFHSGGSHAVAGQPIAATIGDFTGDGVADIAVATFSAGNVTTLVGAGDGTFKMGAFASAGMQPRALVATDLDDDGRLDLVVANQDPNRTDDITLLTAIGGGTFVPGGRYGTFPSASALAIGDFNGDGAPDVAAASAAVSSFDVLYHASFSLPFSRHVDSGARTLAVGDFDEDGIDDLAVSGTGSVAIFLGTHNTALATGPVLVVTSAPVGTASTVVAGDFDGDGHTDLAFADGRQLYLFSNSGGGQFQPERALLATTGNDVQPTQLAAGDLDGDGVADLLVGSVQGQIVELLSTASSLLVTAPSVALAGGTRWATSGDFDGDGNADIAVSQFSNERGVRVLFGDGRGAFPRQQLYEFGQSPGALVAGDLNGDGRSDLMVVDTELPAVGVRLGRADGTLGALNSVAVTATVLALAVLDANEDGRTDLAVPGLGTDSLELFLGKGDGTFQPPVVVAGTGAFDITVADLDGDGHLDLATTDDYTGRVLFGDGRGHFSAPETVLDSNNPISLATGDTDGDGRAELIVADQSPPGIRLVDVRGDRTLVPFGAARIGDESLPVVAAGDFDGDGRADVVFDGSHTDLMGVVLSRGDGSLRPPRLFHQPSLGGIVLVTDLNNDARPDVVTVTSGEQLDPPWQLNIWLGNIPFECR